MARDKSSNLRRRKTASVQRQYWQPPATFSERLYNTSGLSRPEAPLSDSASFEASKPRTCLLSRDLRLRHAHVGFTTTRPSLSAAAAADGDDANNYYHNDDDVY